MANPILDENRFKASVQNYALFKNGVMTLQGTINKTFFLLFVCLLGAMLGWAKAAVMAPLMWPILIGAFVLAMIISFKPNAAPMLSPVYAFLEGLFLGVISLYFNQQYQGIVMQAVGITIGVFFVMLFLYKARIIKVTAGFAKAIISATFGIALFYLATIVLGLFGVNTAYMYDSSPLSIGISLVVCLVAAFNFMLDFNFIEQASLSGQMPKVYEWYGAFGLMVTLIWLYLEILRLLSKFQKK